MISGNTAINNYIGMWLSKSNENTISQNNITYNKRYGMYLEENSNNLIIGNTENNNYVGMWLSKSNENTVSHNNLSYNSLYGMYLEESNYNLIIGNILLYNNKNPINESNCAGNIYQNNIIDENPVFPIFIVVPIIIGIIVLSIVVVFIYKKRVTNKKQ